MTRVSVIDSTGWPADMSGPAGVKVAGNASGAICGMSYLGLEN